WSATTGCCSSAETTGCGRCRRRESAACSRFATSGWRGSARCPRRWRWSCGSIPTRRGTSRRRIARSCSASRCRRYGCGPTRRCWRCGPSGRWLSTAHPERTPFPFVAAKARSLAMSSETPDHRQRILLVTGMLSAGKTTALRALEDLGWEAVDNFPIRLFKRLVGGDDPNPSLAIGFDCRTRDFDPADVIERVKRLED